jgi:hypothetical protein
MQKVQAEGWRALMTVVAQLQGSAVEADANEW